MSFITGIINDLREKRLWPLAVALLAGIVAVPVLLSKAAKSEPAAPLIAQRGSAAGSDVPAVSVSTKALHTTLKGHAHNPFIQQPQPSTTTTAATTTTTPTSGTAGSTGLPVPTTSGGSGGTGIPVTPTPPTTTTTTTTTTSTTTTAPPTGLTNNQAYHVAVSVTDPSGGVYAIDPLERLSILPSAQQAQLVELGVLKGADKVAFAVKPATVLSGPGTCTPGPVDCEILSLGLNQVESVATQTASGVQPLADFAVTSIKADDYASASAANTARRKESADGRKQLNGWDLGALPLFQYQPDLGVVVDLRNLTVGGN